MDSPETATVEAHKTHETHEAYEAYEGPRSAPQSTLPPPTVTVSSSSDGDDNYDDRSSSFFTPSTSQPAILFNSGGSGGSSLNSTEPSPTAVYATMLGANNIVSNSMNVLQGTTRLPNPPTLIEHAGLRFLVMDAPSQSNIHLYLREMVRLGVSDVVRVCEPTYAREIVERGGIAVHDWVFPDGESPPDDVIRDWLALVDRQQATLPTHAPPAIAVHCVAGLGRAPVLVAIALIEHGMRPLDAVMFIRQRRRGAINNRQLKFLESYRSRASRSRGDRCVIF